MRNESIHGDIIALYFFLNQLPLVGEPRREREDRERFFADQLIPKRHRSGLKLRVENRKLLLRYA